MSSYAFQTERVPSPTGCLSCEAWVAKYRTPRMTAGTWQYVRVPRGIAARVFATKIAAHKAAENFLSYLISRDEAEEGRRHLSRRDLAGKRPQYSYQP